MSFFQILTDSGDLIGSAHSLADVADVLRDARPGPYRVQVVSPTPFSSGRWLSQWGTAIRRDDGVVVIEPQQAGVSPFRAPPGGWIEPGTANSVPGASLVRRLASWLVRRVLA
jgi:hypothetical protein